LTFILGVAIGFSIAYAFFGWRKPSPQIQAPVQEVVTPIMPATPPAEMPATEMVAVETAPTPALETPVAEEALWPGRFLFLGVEAPTLNDEMKALLKEVRPGGVVIKGDRLGPVEEVVALVQQIKDAAGGQSPLIAVDQEGGKRNPLGIEKAPSAAELGRGKDPEAAREAGRACGKAAVERGIAVVFGPVLNVLDRAAKETREDDAYVSRDRVFGSDQGLVELMGLAFAGGESEAGAIPVVKYYPGIGTRHKGGAPYVLDASSRKLAELMYPFSEAAAQNIPGIMVGHIAAPELDRKNPDRPASISPVLVQTVLREKFHYEGFILADDVSSDALGAACPSERAVVEALVAGCDGVVFLDARPDRVRAACGALQEAMDKGVLSKDRLMQSHRRWNAWLERIAEANAGSAKEVLAAPGELALIAAGNTATVEAAPGPSAEPAVAEAQPLSETAPVSETSAAVAPQEKPEREPSPVPQPPNTEKVMHVIERGESLAKVAAKYGVRREDIIAWNGMKDSNIKYGFKLIIYRHSLSSPDKLLQGQDAETPPPTDATPASPVPQADEATTIHEVAKGENIYRIAAKYHTTVQRLTEMNKLDRPDRLVAGQKLRVPAQFVKPGQTVTADAP
jgi:beta-N-acetylhexosaminidase